MARLFPVILFFTILLTTFNRGFFSFQAFFLLLIIFFMLLFAFVKWVPHTKEIGQENADESIYGYLLVILYSIFIFFSKGIYESEVPFSLLTTFFPLLVFPLILSYLFIKKRFSNSINKKRFFGLLAFSFLLRTFVINASPAPAIDVFYMLREAPIKLLQGQNPYSSSYTTVYNGVASNYFTYFPGAFLMQLPFVSFFGDPRILMIFADIACAYFLYRIGGRSIKAELLSLIYLFRPNSLFIIEQSWLTSLSFFFVLLSLRTNGILSGIFVGILSSIQPHYILLLPLVSLLKKNGVRFLSGALIALVIMVTPFMFWNFHDFYTDTIGFYLRSSKEMLSVPVYNSLNINTPYAIFFKSDIPPFLLASMFFVLYGFVFRTLYKRKAKSLLLGATLIYLAFFMSLRFSFINYYYFVTDLFILFLIKKDTLI